MKDDQRRAARVHAIAQVRGRVVGVTRRAPEAAVVGIAVTDRFEIVFDTLASSRKAENLRRHPRIAFVIGGTLDGDERTVQYEGVADEPSGAERDRLVAVYLDRFPDGRARQQWPGLTYVRARATWIRYSDYNADPPMIVEFSDSDLRAG